MNCEISITLKGSKIGGDSDTKIVHSDMELDQVLLGRAASLKSWYKINSGNTDRIYQELTPQEKAISILKELQAEIRKARGGSKEVVSDSYKDDLGITWDTEERSKIPNSLGVNTSLGVFGNSHNLTKETVTGVNEKWESNFKFSYAANNNITDVADPRVQSAWEQELAKASKSAEVGEDGHTILELLFKQLTDKSIVIDESKCKYLKGEAFNKTLKVMEEVRDEIMAKHEGAIFLPEFEVLSKELDNNSRTALELRGYKDITRINGRIDLLVIDKDGIAHIYDWKTSLKPVGQWDETDNKVTNKNGWWHSTKKLHANAQVGWYGALLAQRGLEIGEMNVRTFISKYDVVKKDGKWEVANVKPIKADTPITTGKSQTLLAYRQYRTAEYIFGVTKNVSTENLKATNEVLQTVFPGTEADNVHIQQFKASVERYKNNSGFVRELTDKDSEPYKSGYRFYFITKGLPDEKIVYATKETLDEEIEKYVKKLSDYKDTELVHFADSLYKVIATRGNNEDAINEWVSTFREDSASFIKNTFRKYYRNGWNMVLNEDLNNNGIFIFNKGGQMEIVVLTEKDVHYRVPINGNYNICGAKLNDGDRGTDPYNILTSEYGNLMIMKAMALISENKDILSGCKINNIKAINPWHGTESTRCSLKMMIDSWNLIARHNAGIKTVSPDWFFSDVDSYINTAMDLCMSDNISIFANLARPEGDEASYDADTIQKLIKELEKNSSTWDDINTKEGLVHYQLTQALLATQGIHVYEEPEFGKYLDRGLIPNGGNFTNFGQSLSTNQRAVHTLFSRFREEYTQAFNEIAAEFNELTRKVFQAWRFNPAVDRPETFWRQFFEINDKGLPTEQFRLKSPDDSYFKIGKTKEQTESAINLINFIADYFNEFGNKNQGEEQMMRAQEDGSYYEVPLMNADFGQYVRDTNTKEGALGVIKGMWNGIKKKWRPITEEVFQGGRTRQREWEYHNNPYKGAFNPYMNVGPMERIRLLSDPSNIFSTDLQAIFLNTAAASMVTKASKKYIPYFLAFKAGLSYSITVGKANIPELEETINEFIDAKVLHKNIRDASLDLVADLTSALRRASSTVTLGLNTRAFAREMLVNTYEVFTRSRTGVLMAEDGPIKVDNLWKALQEVSGKVPPSLSTQNFMAYINRRYAASGMSSTEMAETNKINKYGLGQFSTDNLYIGSKLPDDYFRVAVVFARMYQDGSYDAYEEFENGFRYNIAKDKRFNKLFKQDGSIISREETDDIKEWAKQNARYLKYIDDWGKIGIKIEYGNTLPDAYSPDEKAAIRRGASNLFGDFDTEEKSLLTHKLLGAAFMQYKTWLAAKINQHLKSPGFENQWQTYIEVDEDGDRLWKIVSTPEEISNGKEPIQFVKEKDLTAEDIESGRAEPSFITEGTYTSGMVQSTGRFLADLAHWDVEKLKQHWDNPMMRGQLLNGLMDTLGCMILLGIIKLIYGEDTVNNKEDQDWWTQWSYGVLVGFAEDGPINKILVSTVSDLNPPAITTLKSWARTANSVLAGNKTIGEGILQTFGATREFRGMVG